MFEKFTGMVRSRRATRLLLVLFCLLAVATAFVGLRSTGGYTLGYLATAMLYILLTRRWHSVRAFIVLFAASAFSIGFLSFLYVEVISRLALALGGPAAMSGVPMHVIELVLTYLIIFGGVTGVFFGLAGAFILGGFRWAARHDTPNPAGTAPGA